MRVWLSASVVVLVLVLVLVLEVVQVGDNLPRFVLRLFKPYKKRSCSCCCSGSIGASVAECQCGWLRVLLSASVAECECG